jgi:hypothetical protein
LFLVVLTRLLLAVERGVRDAVSFACEGKISCRVLALILLVSKLMAILDKLVAIGTVFRPQSSFSMLAERSLRLVFAVVPHSSPPLRI